MHLRRVVQRQGVHRQIALRQVQGRDRALVLVAERLVRHHRPLRQGGGPGGVQQLRQPGRVPGAGEGPGSGGLRRFGEEGEEGAGRVAQRAYGEPVRDPPGRLGVREDEGAPGVLQDVREVLPGEVLVDGDVREPGPGAGEEGEEVGVGVVPEGRDPVPLGQPVAPAQDGRARGDGRVEFRVGPGPLAVADRDPVRDAPRAVVEQSVDRVLPHRGHGGIFVCACGRGQ